jgi:hypothetical protein
MPRWNATQATLNRAAACRAWDMMETSIAVRERIIPIRDRHLARLAAMVSAQPIGDRRHANRRANRAGR